MFAREGPGCRRPRGGRPGSVSLRPRGRVFAIDAGTTGVRALVVDERGGVPTWPTASSPALPAPGLGRTRSGRDLGRRAVHLVGALPANSGDAVAAIGITDQRETLVAFDRPTGHRWLAPSSGRTVAPRPSATRWAPRDTSRSCAPRRPGPRSLLRPPSRPGSCATAPGAGRRRPEALLLHRGQLGPVESDRGRRGACHRPVQRQPHAPARYRDAGLVADLCDSSTCPARAARVGAVERRFGSAALTGSPGARPTRGRPHLGRGGRPAGRLFGQACLAPGMTKVTTARAASP